MSRSQITLIILSIVRGTLIFEVTKQEDTNLETFNSLVDPVPICVYLQTLSNMFPILPCLSKDTISQSQQILKLPKLFTVHLSLSFAFYINVGATL